MVLDFRSQNTHNVMLGRRRQGAHTAPTTCGHGTGRPAKRLKLDDTSDSDTPSRHVPVIAKASHSPRRDRHGSTQPETGAEHAEQQAELETEAVTATDLENTLPPVKTDKEAIEEYEAFRASQQEEGKEDELSSTTGRLSQRKWVKGKSSIYVDAFNLALDTVLEDEAHLFDEAELAVFEQWRELSYEGQYL